MAKNKVTLDLAQAVPFAGGGSFGDTGPYERLLGKAHFAIDPDEEGLPYVVDLDLAPRNAEGLVEFSATLDIIKPVDISKGNRRVLYEFSNRGNRGLMGFNYGRGADITSPEYAGDGFLMRHGYTLMWSGWQGDLIDQGTNVVAYLPFALKDGHPLRGKVRQEFNVLESGVLSMGVSAGAEGGANVQPYPVVDRATATLTMREKEADARIPVPDGDWDLAKAEVKDGRVVLTSSANDLYVKEGFKPGWIYEFIYETEGSRVMNLGFLGIRDLLSMLRHEATDSAGNQNPLAGHVDKVYGTGASLSGRVIREYVYEGWNEDPEGRRVFDAVHTHTGSGRLFQNQRFAQVGRYPRQHEEHSWPAEYYPFTFAAVADPFTERNEGLWQRPETDPLVIHLHTEGDYWVRHVSLTHTDPRDASDVTIPENARMYHMTGAPHMVRAIDDPNWIGQLAPNAIAAVPYRRAVLAMLDGWATEGTAPPPSMLPKTSDGTLVTAEEALEAYPKLGVQLPKLSRMPRYNYGPGFDSNGVMSVFPPQPFEDQEYLLRVPAIDADGNTIAGLRFPDIEVPLGTYNGWSLRKAGYSEGEQWWNTGSFIPFARTKAEREAKIDPRPSIEERYPSHKAYIQAVTDVCAKRIGEGFMLQEDAERFIAAAKARNPLDPSVPLAPLIQAGAYTGR
jgi:alpha/beta hydrolase family protein